MLLAAVPLSAQSRWSVGADGDYFAPIFDQADGSGTYSIYDGFSAGAFVFGRYAGQGPGFLDAGVRYKSISVLRDDALESITGTRLTLVGAEAGGGVGFAPLRWLDVSVGARFGIYDGWYDLNGTTVSGSVNPYAIANAGVSLALTPTTRLSLGAGYSYFSELISALRLALAQRGSTLEPSDPTPGEWASTPLAQGISGYIGLTLSLGAEATGPRQPQIEIQLPEFDPVFPVFYRYYNESPLGLVRITNGERETITDVRISLLVASFMDAPKEAAVVPEIAPGDTVEIPLLALFNDSILGVTEGSTVTAEILVAYDVDNETLAASRASTMDVRNRNNMTWDDDNKAAAFVTANDPTVGRFARNVSSSVRDSGFEAINDRIRLAAAVYEALRLYGLTYQIDPDSSYIELSEDAAAVDYLQFPQQTLDFRTGDCDDLSVLYTALMESLGIPSAFVTIPGHIYVAIDLGIEESVARRTFAAADDFIYLEGTTWMPVEVTLVRDDFISAWSTGAKQWRDNAPRLQAALLPVRDAWGTYLPTGFASQPLDIDIPAADDVARSYESTIERFVLREIEPQVADLRARIEASNNNPRLANRLGTLYGRYGLYDEAEAVFSDVVAETEYAPALVNLGNIAYIRQDLAEARGYYERADAARPGDPAVLISLARIDFDLANYESAESRYRQVEILDPDLAAQFDYIVSASSDAGRASDAAELPAVIWEDD